MFARRAGEQHFLREFQSWTEYVDFAEKNARKNGASHLNGDDFAMASFDEAIKLARDGWKEGRDKIQFIASPVFDALSSRIPKRRVRLDVYGGSVLVGRYLAGMPDHFQRYKQTKHSQRGRGRRLLHIVYNQSTSGGISTDIMRARGGTVAALVQLLDYAGFVTELTLVDASLGFNYNMNLTWQLRVPVKRAGTLVDPSRIAFALSHPACLRRLAFGVMEGEKDFSDYGAPMEVTQWVEKGDIYIGSATYGDVQWSDEAHARSWIIDQLEAQGIELR